MTITNNNSDILVTYDDGHTRNVLKNQVTDIIVKRDGTTIIMNLSAGTNRHANSFIPIPYSKVTSPVTTSVNQLRDLLVAYAASNTAALASGTFVNGDLVAGVLTITHGKNITNLMSVITDPNGVSQLMVHTVVDANTITVDFGGAIAAGTWSWFIIGV